MRSAENGLFEKYLKLLAGRGAGHPDSPHLERIMPYLGNTLKTEPFAE
jgi:hypothetical protein